MHGHRSQSHLRLWTVLILALAAGCENAVTPLSPEEAQFAKQPLKGTWTVNSLDDPGDGVCSTDHCTLREAIAAAQAGERIVFKNNLTGTIALSAELVIDVDLSIEGPGADKLTVDAQGVIYAFRTTHTADCCRTVSIAGLGVTGAHASGIYNGQRNDLTLSRVDVHGNGSVSFNGGGILHEGGALVLIDSSVRDNIGGTGGGIFHTFSSNSLTLINTTVSGNRAGGFGGGIHINGPDVVILRSTISGNQAGDDSGGAMYAGNTTFIISSTITANRATASQFGAGVVVGSSQVASVNSIIAGNQGEDCSGVAMTSYGWNLTSNGGGCPGNGPGDVVVFPGQVFNAVLEQSLADNGGLTRTHALIERGFAVDAGYCPGENADQRGLPRPYDDPALVNAVDACDIGAFEWQPDSSKGRNK